MKVDRTVVAKVPASTVAPPIGSLRPGTMVSVASWLSVAGVSLPARKMPSLASIPILHDILSDEEEEEKEKGDSKGSKDVKVERLSSSSDSIDSSAGDDDDDDDNDDRDELDDPRRDESEELGL